MGLFNTIGKFVGGIVTAVVPGADRLAATGIFGSDLQQFATGQSPVASAVAASPALTTALTAPPAVVRPATVPVRGPGDTINVPRVHLVALVGEARKVTFRPPQAAPLFMPRQQSPMTIIGRGQPFNPNDPTSLAFAPARPPAQVFQVRDQLGRIINVAV